MQVTINMKGISGIRAEVEAKIQSIKAQVNAAVQGAGIDCQALAKQASPVDTGRLRSSIQYVKTGEASCQVSTNVWYAVFVEKGHRTVAGTTVAPRPFLFPAAQQAGKTLIQELKAIKV